MVPIERQVSWRIEDNNQQQEIPDHCPGATLWFHLTLPKIMFGDQEYCRSSEMSYESQTKHS